MDKEKNSISRRSALKKGLLGGLASAVGAGAAAAKSDPTPSQTEGPFYPQRKQKDKDFDLTQIEGKKEKAKGDVIWVTGKVVDQDGKPIEDATVEVWQANAGGRYIHPHDNSDIPLDPNFQGWAVVPSGKDGGFKYKTIMPGAYPLSKKVMRPPHIHYKVTKFGYESLTTQMYFEGNELNAKDALLQRAGKNKDMLIAKKKVVDKETYYDFTIVLAAVE